VGSRGGSNTSPPLTPPPTAVVHVLNNFCNSTDTNTIAQQALVDVLDQNIRENTGMRETKFWHKTSIMFLHKAL
jgi:hypothetical protein